ncbi:FxLYD domain-containing protein [Halobium salinum]|uniref:FxLYD domain-containing protein n=1 Tax=Halobium salinum TaxID=1364940 RepID=A0ABD5PDZ3_9EURY|nr:FxLYD domain-containing protein [Halobium salinum]
MRRREILALAGTGLVGSVAGCTGEGGTETMDGSEGTEAGSGDSGSESTTTGTTTAASTGTMTPTATPTTTATSTPSGTADVGIGKAELVKESGSYTTDVGAQVDVENSGSARVGQIELSAKFYDDSDSLLENSSGFLPTLGAGQMWDAYVMYLGSNPENVASVEVDGQYAERVPDYNPDELPVSGVSTEKTDMEVMTTGSVKNDTGGSVSYLEAVAIYKKDENTVLNSGLDNVNDVPAGDNWKFETSAMPPKWRMEEYSGATVFVSMSNY